MGDYFNVNTFNKKGVITGSQQLMRQSVTNMDF